MDYEIYHDETLEGGYWHGMLLVPVDKKQLIVSWLDKCREIFKYPNVLGIKNIKKKGAIFKLARSWISISCFALMHNFKGQTQLIPIMEHRKKFHFFELKDPICMKFILFKTGDSHDKMESYTDHASKIETTCRMGIKGGIHLFGSNESPIHITKIHFDGYEHLKRNIDQNRIVKKMKEVFYTKFPQIEKTVWRRDKRSNKKCTLRRYHEVQHSN